MLVWPRHSQHAERDTFTAEWLELQGLFTALRCLQWCWTQSGQHARVDYSGIWQHALCAHVFVWMDGWLSVCLCVLCWVCIFLGRLPHLCVKASSWVTPSPHFVTCFWSFKRHCPHCWINKKVVFASSLMCFVFCVSPLVCHRSMCLEVISSACVCRFTFYRTWQKWNFSLESTK